MCRRNATTLVRDRNGQALVEVALLLPLMLIVVVNAINAGYYFYVYLNMTTSPRQGVQYSILGGASTLGTNLPEADEVNSLVSSNITGSIASASGTPIRVCSASIGVTGSGTGQVSKCNNYGGAAGTFAGPNPDPEAPYLILNRVDIQYHVSPLIPGGIFNLLGPTSGLTFHRMVEMRAEP
jgi:Flp pilus assembly protein TadG